MYFMIDVSVLFIFFAGYSFIGWVCETIYCTILSKKFINRGFLNGPFCPVYGFGALILLFCFHGLPPNIAFVFLAGTMITTALEYLTAVLLEKLFHAKWWDYSDIPFNFQGRVCLLNSVLFGIMSVGFAFVISPFAIVAVFAISQVARVTICAVLLIYFSVDIVMTVRSLNSLNLRLETLNKILLAAKEKLDISGFYNTLNIAQRFDKLHELLETEKGQAIYNSLAGIRERIRQLESDNRVLQARIIKAFPSIRSTRYPEMLTMVKERILHVKKDTDKNNDTIDTSNKQ
jgi:uncharacterized membrane protein